MRLSPIRLAVRAAVLTAVVAGTAAFVAVDSYAKTVTVSVDGRVQAVHTFAGTVDEVLDEAGIPTGEHDLVVPEAREPVADGDAVTVRYGRPLRLSVDGRERLVWVTAPSVDAALRQVGVRGDDAFVSVSRSAAIGRSGLAVELRTRKTVTLFADRTKRAVATTAADVAGALRDAGVRLGRSDRVTPAAGTRLVDGQKIVVNRVVQRASRTSRPVAYPVVTRKSPRLYVGQKQVAQPGRPGVRTVVYRDTLVDGRRTDRVVVSDRVTRRPQSRVVLVGTRQAAADGLDWAALARCESGGNPRANSGNGYYGLYQFSFATWQAVGGSGNPAAASSAEQTARAQRLYARSGRAAWPYCGRYL